MSDDFFDGFDKQSFAVDLLALCPPKVREEVERLQQQLAAERQKRCGTCANAALRTPPQKHWCKTLLTAVTDDFGCHAWRQREEGQ